MKQHPARPSTVDSLGLASWTPTGGTTDGLGSLSDVLGDFVVLPTPRIVVPAQRTSTLLEVLH